MVTVTEETNSFKITEWQT